MTKDARDIPPDYLRQTCHPSRSIGTVICLICDSGYCKSDFTKKVQNGSGFFVTRHTVICPTHTNITYKTIERICEQYIDSESLIIQIKLALIQKYIENIQNGMNLTQTDETKLNMETEQEEEIETMDANDNTTDKRKKCKVDHSDLDKECDYCQEYFNELNIQRR